jgi:hypothetical protein
MSTAVLYPHPDLYDSSSISNGFDTKAIKGDMVLTVFRVAAGNPACGLLQVIQHADVDGNDYVDHPANVTDYLGDFTAVVLLQRVRTRRFIRVTNEPTPPTDDPRYVWGAILHW